MTTEVIIMNREAVALTSDSAVTLSLEKGQQKIFTSANKIYRLSNQRPVGIMIYGSASLMQIPWETIIKVYRDKLEDEKFGKLYDYATDFINFLDSENSLFPFFIQEEYLKANISGYFNLIKKEIEDIIRSIINDRTITDNEIKHIIFDVIERHYDIWENTDNIPSIPNSYNKDILKKYDPIIGEIITQIFQLLTMYEYNHLKKIASNLFSKYPKGVKRLNTGVVITGFGEEDTFPSLTSFYIDGIVNNRLKYVKSISTHVDTTNKAVIIPFAQTEMVHTFIRGIDPELRVFQDGFVHKIFEDHMKIIINNIGLNQTEKQNFMNILNNKNIEINNINNEIIKEYNNKIGEYINNEHIKPIISIVSMLPKSELASMAESLVSMTSFKRRISTDQETVGGPIDVAVISKGDGFVWIKRKHYFKPELNQRFFINYNKEAQNE